MGRNKPTFYIRFGKLFNSCVSSFNFPYVRKTTICLFFDANKVGKFNSYIR